MGGIQNTVGTKLLRQTSRTCGHAVTLSTIAAGLERVVCEACGHLSFRWHEDLLAYIEREQPRAKMPTRATTDSGLFSPHTRFNVRGRYELHPERPVTAGRALQASSSSNSSMTPSSGS
ncbi:MAG: hypothetical protein ACRDZM_15535 [Acidimicrobiia bacterium]